MRPATATKESVALSPRSLKLSLSHRVEALTRRSYTQPKSGVCMRSHTTQHAAHSMRRARLHGLDAAQIDGDDDMDEVDIISHTHKHARSSFAGWHAYFFRETMPRVARPHSFRRRHLHCWSVSVCICCRHLLLGTDHHHLLRLSFSS